MSDTMQKYNNKLLAEESVANFIEYIEETSEEPVSDADKIWLFKKGEEIFEAYYVDGNPKVFLSTEEDVEILENYLQSIQETLGRMFGHIILVEYKLYLLNQALGI